MNNYLIKCIAVSALSFVSVLSINTYSDLVTVLPGYAILGGTPYDTDAEGNIPVQQVLGSETDYNLFKMGVKNQFNLDLPDYSESASFVDNICNYFIGNVVRGQDLVVDAVLEGIDYASDILEFISFDPDNGCFVRSPNGESGLIESLHPHLYNPPSQTVGNWVSIPCRTNNMTVNGTTYWFDLTTDGVAYASIVRTGSSRVLLMATFVNGTKVMRYENYLPSGRYLMSTYTLGTRYQGSETVGFYSQYATGESIVLSDMSSYYTSVDSALADLFGATLSDEETLKDGLVLIDNPTFAPLSLPSALTFDFEPTIKDPTNLEPLSTNIVNYWPKEYTYTYPYWGGMELETLSYPTELEFPSLEFTDIEVDENVDTAIESLGGSWIIEFLLIAILLLIVGLIL